MSLADNRHPETEGEPALQTLAMPKDTNASGDIFGGWLVSQMDLAAGIISRQVTKGRSATVAIQNVTFLKPVSVGSSQLLLQSHQAWSHIGSHRCGGMDMAPAEQY